MICIAFFTVSSVLCGLATSLGLLLLFRVLQGLGGGGLQPLAQAILADTFPPQQRGLAFALYGITAVVAPTVGPVLGGWITYNYSWRWIFFINLPVGALTLFLVLRLIEDPPYLQTAKLGGVRFDYIGVALLVMGVGALQIMPPDAIGANFLPRQRFFSNTPRDRFAGWKADAFTALQVAHGERVELCHRRISGERNRQRDEWRYQSAINLFCPLCRRVSVGIEKEGPINPVLGRDGAETHQIGE